MLFIFNCIDNQKRSLIIFFEKKLKYGLQAQQGHFAKSHVFTGYPSKHKKYCFFFSNYLLHLPDLEDTETHA